MKVAKTVRVPAGDLKIGDVIIVPRCPSIDSGGELYGGSSVILETIADITETDNDGVRLKTRWRREYSSGDTVYEYSKYSFVTKL